MCFKDALMYGCSESEADATKSAIPAWTSSVTADVIQSANR